jgi:hypothetical protein
MSDQETTSSQIPVGLLTIHGDPAKLFAALAAAQAAYLPIVRDKEVTVRTKPKDGQPSYTYTFKYAPIQNLKEACTAALSGRGLTIFQPFTRDSDGFTLRTILAHSSGAYIEAIVDGPNGDSWQALGSALTYAQRYSYAGMAGCVADDDDDGNAADGNTVTASSTKQPPKAPQAPAKASKPAQPKPEPKAPPAKAQAPDVPPPESLASSEALPPEAVTDQEEAQRITPETEKALKTLLKAKKYDINSGPPFLRSVVGRDTRYQNPDGTWDTNMTEDEGIKVIEALQRMA